MPGKIYLLPCPIAENALDTIPESTRLISRQLRYFVVERARTARRYLKELDSAIPIQELLIEEWTPDTDRAQLKTWLQPVLEGKDLGILSEAGCPGIADPGADIVALAHQLHIEVVPMVGPSSLLLALMASGLNGQSFCFHGYLPAKKELLPPALRELERKALRDKQTQLFIETPYRLDQMLEACLKNLQPQTRLCLAVDLSAPGAYVKTDTIRNWQQQKQPAFGKKAAVFLICA